MSPKNSLLHTGLAALGWLGLTAPGAAADPAPASPPGQGRTAAAVAVAAPSPTLTVLSLYDGRLYQGKVQVDATGYSVLQRGGVLRFRKELVEGAFASIEETYRFKAERVPARDPDERLKLARWCLAHKLNAEAKAQLLAVLELSPGNVQINNMIVNIDNAAAAVALRDEAIQRARAEVPADGRPAELDPGILRAGASGSGSGGGGRAAAAAGSLPEIFDLPRPVAVKRANEFTRSIHPVVQRACAHCHNEKYQGAFQLIEVKTRHDLTETVARANLEAVLRLIDADSPTRSELLTRGLVPHGPYKRPVFQGATDPGYKQLEGWVKSLRPQTPADQAATGRFRAPEPAAAAEPAGFASDRMRPPAMPPPLPPGPAPDGRPQPPAMPNEVIPQPPGRYVAGSGSAMQPYAPPDAEFPVPYLAGGPRPKLEANPAAPAAQARSPGTTPSGIALPPLPPTTPAPAPAPAPTPASAAPATAAATPAAPAAKPAPKPVKIDPALLERALTNKYAPH